MIVFKTARARRGRKSKWSKKFPRKKILHRGDEKYCNWFRNNWADDNYSYFAGDLHKFLISNIGRPVDKVFSEFLKRCSRNTRMYDLKGTFYDMFKKKSDIDYTGGFYITNGILNYKKRTKKPISKPYVCMEDFNREALPILGPICRSCDATHTKQLFGVFRLNYNVKKSVYIIERDVYDSDLKLQARYKPCYIPSVGEGVSILHWTSGYSNTTSYQLYSNWDIKTPNSKYMFITKIERI